MEETPRLHILFSMGAHGSSEDGRRAAFWVRKFKPHVFVDEFAGLTKGEFNHNIKAYKRALEKTRGVSGARALRTHAKRIIREMRRPGYDEDCDRELYPVLLASRTPVFFFERHSAGKAKKLEKIDKRSDKTEDDAKTALLEGRYAQALRLVRQHVWLDHRYNSSREKVIVQAVRTARRDLLKHYPHLRGEKELRVLVRLGVEHTPPYIWLKKQELKGITLARSFDMNPASLDPALHFATLKPEQFRQKGDLLFAYRLLYGLLEDEMEKRAPAHTEKHLAATQLLARKGSRDLKELSKAASEGKSGKERIHLLLKKFEELHQPLPRNSAEMTELLQKEFGAGYRYLHDRTLPKEKREPNLRIGRARWE